MHDIQAYPRKHSHSFGLVDYSPLHVLASFQIRL